MGAGRAADPGLRRYPPPRLPGWLFHTQPRFKHLQAIWAIFGAHVLPETSFCPLACPACTVEEDPRESHDGLRPSTESKPATGWGQQLQRTHLYFGWVPTSLNIRDQNSGKRQQYAMAPQRPERPDRDYAVVWRQTESFPSSMAPVQKAMPMCHSWLTWQTRACVSGAHGLNCERVTV